MKRLALIVVTAALAALAVGPAASLAGAPSRVVVNGVRLAPARLHALEFLLRGRVLTGLYWYDRRSGAWGRLGGPTAGFIPAGLRLGGPLRANASGSSLPVFINGRSLLRWR